MVSLASLMEFSWVDRSLASLWIEHKDCNLSYGFALFQKSLPE